MAMKVENIPNEYTGLPIGEMVVIEAIKHYDEERADEINQAVVALLPGKMIRVWVIPVPVGLLKVALLRILDSQTPEMGIKALYFLLKSIGLVERPLDDLYRRTKWPGDSE